jgi:hypothetical protein
MAIGDSFLMDLTVKPSSMHRMACLAGKRLKRKFSCRTSYEGVRIWRIA